MSFLIALAFACSLTNGRRIQPSAHALMSNTNRQHTPADDSPISVQSEKHFVYNESLPGTPDVDSIASGPAGTTWESDTTSVAVATAPGTASADPATSSVVDTAAAPAAAAAATAAAPAAAARPADAPAAPPSVAAATVSNSSDTTTQREFEKLRRFSSFVQQEEVTLARNLQNAFSVQTLQHAFSSAKIKMLSPESPLGKLPESVLGLILLGSGVLASICFGCCLARLLVAYNPKKGTRIQHFHEGRVVYEWDQTHKVATVYIRPPDGVRKSDLDIRISARNVRVGRKGRPFFLTEETYDLVNEEMSSWSLRSNGELQIFLRKVKRAQWPRIFCSKQLSMNSKFKPARKLEEKRPCTT